MPILIWCVYILFIINTIVLYVIFYVGLAIIFTLLQIRFLICDINGLTFMLSFNDFGSGTGDFYPLFSGSLVDFDCSDRNLSLSSNILLVKKSDSYPSFLPIRTAGFSSSASSLNSTPPFISSSFFYC